MIGLWQRLWRSTRGDALPFALVAMATGSLLVMPLLGLIRTSEQTTTAAAQAAKVQYTTDAGAEFALVQLKNDPSLVALLHENVGLAQYLTLSENDINGLAPDVRVVCVRAPVEASTEPEGGEDGGGEPTGTMQAAEWAIWANSEDEKHTITTLGKGHTILGGVHSNNEIKIGGIGHVMSGTVEYASGSAPGPPAVTIHPGPPILTPTVPFPISWDIDWFKPGGYYDELAGDKYYTHTENWSITGTGHVVDEGIHYCTGKVNMSGTGIIMDGVTIVSEDTINIAGSSMSFMPSEFSPGLTFFSSMAADVNVISVSGYGNVGGTCFAPKGQISLNGAGSTIQGVFYGDVVHIGGSGSTIDARPIELPVTTGPPPEGGGEGVETVYKPGIYDVQSILDGMITMVRLRMGEDVFEVLSWQVQPQTN